MAKAFMSGVDALVLQEKTVNVTENGTVEVIPDEGKLLRKVTAKIDTPVPKAEQEKVVKINGNGTIDILPDTGKVLSRVTAVVNVEGGSDAPDEPVAPEYSEGLLIEWDDWACAYSVNDRGSCTDSVVRIPEIYDDGVNGESFVTEFGIVHKVNADTWQETTTYPFYQDELLEEIYLPSGMESPFNSFSLQECPNLKKVYGVQNISSIELRNLPSLEYVEFVQYSEMALEIGGAIGSGNGVVYDFTKCTSVPYFDSYGFGSEFGTDPVILVPAELYDEWKSATNWTLYADYIVVKGQENVQEKEVEYTENGSYEVIPDEGKLLSKVSVNVNVGGGGDSVSIDDFIEGNITEIRSDVTTIRNYAFYQAGKLESVSFPNATDIGNSAFYYCEALESIYFPKATNIGQYVFYHCKALKSVDFPNVTTIGNNALDNCTRLESIYFPNATAIGQYAFQDCIALKSVDFPNVKSLNGSCFRDCSELTSVRIPKVESIVGYTFYNCKKCLEYDFSGCTAVPTLSNTNAFQNINSNAQIKVPAALYDEWIAATNWTTYASKIVAV